MNSANSDIARRLEEIAHLLEEQHANVFRVEAYRRAAAALRELDKPVEEIVRSGGIEALQKLSGIGETLARLIHQIVVTGRSPMLERLRGESDPLALLATVPGIGKKTAEVIHSELGIETLEELEIAAHDGRLAAIKGFGEKRITGVRDSLAARLGRVRSHRGSNKTSDEPPVDEILEIDREYLQKSRQEVLPTIAPRRFNPTHAKWLPILHTSRGDRHYTALFSNTPRAHQLRKTSDWVVIYLDGDRGERQCTVITAMYGPLAGRRIVRGREAECLKYYLRPIQQQQPNTKSQNTCAF